MSRAREARQVPVVAELARPEGLPRGLLLAVASEGLRAMGLYSHAEVLGGPAVRARIKASGLACLDVEAAYAAAGLEDWATLATRTACYLRLALDGLRGAT
jgi:hypothetical protein